VFIVSTQTASVPNVQISTVSSSSGR
jgi:hypothetical protein